MKIVKKTQKVYDSFVEQYELNDMLLARSDFMPGSLIVYLLSSARNVKLLSFYFSEETEIGGQRQVITGEGSDFCKQFYWFGSELMCYLTKYGKGIGI